MTDWLLLALTRPVLALKALHLEDLPVPGPPTSLSWLITPVSSRPTLRVGESAFHLETSKRGFKDPGKQVSPAACSTLDALKAKVIPVAAQLAVELDQWPCFPDDWAKVCALGGRNHPRNTEGPKESLKGRSALGIPRSWRVPVPSRPLSRRRTAEAQLASPTVVPRLLESQWSWRRGETVTGNKPSF